MGIELCFETWQYQGSEGYVFLSERKEGTWKDHSFRWPQDRGRITQWFNARNNGESSDIYWSPSIYRAARRIKKNALAGRILYADLDPVDPRTLSKKPTVAWESSTGRYHALWFLSEKVSNTDFERMNKALSYEIGADKGGWDITQVLRIPGTLNHKYSPPDRVKLLWDASSGGRLYSRADFALEDVREQNITSSDGPTLVELVSKYRKQIKPRVSRLLQYPPSRVEKGHRSDMLWYIESELVSAKIPLEDVIRMVALSPWNKYKGRSDEWERLTTEITKVYENLGQALDNEVEDEDEIDTSLPWQSFQDLMGSLDSQPGWLVRDLWLRQSHGIIAAEPKAFKSVTSLDLAISVASGKKLWDRYEVDEQGPVIIIQNENAEWIMKDRVMKIMASKGLVGDVVASKNKRRYEVRWPQELPIYFLNNYGYNFSDPLHRQELEQMIKEVKPVLIIFDPLYLMFEGEINSATDLQPVLMWLLELKNKYRTAIMVIHHNNKSGTSSRGGQRMLGSTTLHGWVESAWYLKRLDDGTKAIAEVEIEREFRAAGTMAKLTLGIQMGAMNDPTYSVVVGDAVEKTNQEMTELIDLLSMYPAGLSQNQAATELGITRKRLAQLVESNERIQTKPGARGAKMIYLS